jgi:hypothetical protein
MAHVHTTVAPVCAHRPPLIPLNCLPQLALGLPQLRGGVSLPLPGSLHRGGELRNLAPDLVPKFKRLRLNLCTGRACAASLTGVIRIVRAILHEMKDWRGGGGQRAGARPQ